MKSKILLLLFVFVLAGKAFGQPLNWREDSPANFVPLTVEGEFDKVSEGKKAVKITFTETGTPYFVSDTFKVTGGAAFSFSIDILDNSPGGEYNQRIRFINADGTGTNMTSAAYTADNAAYQTMTYTGTTPATAVKAYVIIRIYDVAASWTGSAAFYLDNAKYTEGTSTTNLIVNGGFENWKQPNIPADGSPLKWKEESPANFVPLKVIPEFTNIKHGNIAAKITFTETGTPYFVSDTFKVTGGAAFNYSIDILDNSPGGEYNQRIRFVNADGTGTNMTSSVYTADNAAYQTMTYTGTTPATAVKAYVIIRIYDVPASWTGSATFYLDNAKYTEGTSATNLIANPSFENWTLDAKPRFITYKFEGLNPQVSGSINVTNSTVTATVPFATNLTNLVATFTMSEGASAKVGATDQVSGTTPNNFTAPVKYTLVKGTSAQEWTVTVNKAAASAEKEIITFRFNGLTPPVAAKIDAAAKTVLLEVPSGTNVTALIPTITLSEFASVSPASGVAQNFTSPVNYTVTAQDGTTQVWKVTVTFGVAGQTVLFFEDFEKLMILPAGWVLINNDKYTQAAGEERWKDSAWVVSTSSRTELRGTKVAMSSSFTSNMPLDGRADDWMILPEIQLGGNSTLSWNAMSTTSSGNYPDDYWVLIAPSTAGVKPTVAYFEENGVILLKVAPENWSATVGRPGQGLASRSINLKSAKSSIAPDGWFNKKVWIAFVNTTDRYTNPSTGVPNASAGGSNLAIDNIKVVNDTGTGVQIPELSGIRIYPNPVSGKLNIELSVTEQASAFIKVTDLSGRQIISLNNSLSPGFNRLNLNISELENGMYLVETFVDGKRNITKITVQN